MLMMMNLVRDVRYALRMLKRSPGFSAVVVLVLGLSIGANTALFGLLDAVFWRPLPVPQPERIVSVLSVGTDGALSYQDYLDFRAQSPSLAGLLAFTAQVVTFAEGHRDPTSAFAYGVTANYFGVLGVNPSLGRTFDVTAEAPGTPAEIVISDLFWRSHFGADHSVIGRNVLVNRVPLTVVGVTPPGFAGTQRGAAPDFWVPLTMGIVSSDLEARRSRGLLAVGRLRAGASVTSAAAELRVVAQRLALQYPDTNEKALWVSVLPEREAIFRAAPQLALVNGLLLTLVGLALAIACLNLAALVTARATFRRRELAMRATLGATRRQLAAQLLTESALLAALGGLAGLVVGAGLRQALWRWLEGVADFHGLWIDLSLDPRLVGFTLCATLGTVLVFGLAPALHASSDGLQRVTDDAPSPGSGPLSTPSRRLLAAQVALSVLLLSCAGLLVQSVRRFANADPGYPLDGTYVATVMMDTIDVVDPDGAVDRAAARLRTIPGVEAVGVADGPAGQHGWPGYLPDSEFGDPQAPRNVVFSRVGPDFFAAMRVPMREGREFDERDRKGAPKVVILNHLLAERLYPGQEATGRLLRVWGGEPPLRVVGVAETINAMPINPPWPTIHVPAAQHKHDRLTIHVSAPSIDPRQALGLIASELRKAGPPFSTIRPQTMREAQGRFFTALRGVVLALSTIGGMALLLASIGLYGLTVFVVGRRTREIGIRRALGAPWPAIYALIVGGTLHTVGIGLGLGIFVSLGAGYVAREALLGAAFDPSPLLVAPLVLAATAILAASLPALRATRVDPMVVLREL